MKYPSVLSSDAEHKVELNHVCHLRKALDHRIALMASLYKRPRGRQANNGKIHLGKKMEATRNVLPASGSPPTPSCCCLARGCARCPCFHSWCCATLQRAGRTSPRVTITARFKPGRAIVDAWPRNNAPARGVISMLMHVLATLL